MTPPITVNAPKRRFTVAEYHRLGKVGILRADDRVELIHGEIIQMSPIGPKHAGNLDRIVRLLTLLFKEQAIIRVQSPILLTDENEPEPDITVLKPRDDFYTKAHPGPADVLLVIELSETTLAYDRDVKLPLYASAGITEYWIVDLKSERVITHSGIQLEDVKIYSKGEQVQSSALPEAVVVDRLIS